MLENCIEVELLKCSIYCALACTFEQCYTDRILYSNELHEIISELKLQRDFSYSCKQNKCTKKTD